MDEIFKKINELYEEYANISDAENTEREKLGKRQKIIAIVWQSKKNYKEHSLEVVKTVIYSLKDFPDSDDCKKEGVPFSQYLIFSLDKAINTAKGEEALEQRTGLSISDSDHRKIRRINQCIKVLLRMNPLLNENAIIEKVAATLKEEESEIRSLIRLAKSASLELEIHNDEDDGSLLIEEIHEDMVEKNPVEESYILHEKAEKILSLIDSEFGKKSDPMLSELLTVFILKQDFNVKDLVKYAFINREICATYSKGPEHKLPEDSEIAEKYGKSKSAASKKLSRFFEPFKESLKNF